MEDSIRKIEKVYSSMSLEGKNEYHRSIFFPALFPPVPNTYSLSPSSVLDTLCAGCQGLRQEESPRPEKGAYGMQSCAPAGQRFNQPGLFPPPGYLSYYHPEHKSLWPGKLVRVLGGFAIPDSIMELKTFFSEMELLLMKNNIVHFFPEGELKPYDTRLRDFKEVHSTWRLKPGCP